MICAAGLDDETQEYGKDESYTKFITELCVWFEFAIVGAAAVASHEPMMFVLDRVLPNHVRVDDAP